MTPERVKELIEQARLKKAAQQANERSDVSTQHTTVITSEATGGTNTQATISNASTTQLTPAELTAKNMEISDAITSYTTASGPGADGFVERSAVDPVLATHGEPQQINVDDSRGHKAITLNEKQLAFNRLVQAGEDCVLIGAAGTGKTTTMNKTTRDLIAAGPSRLPVIAEPTRHLKQGLPGAAVLSFTRKAVNNIRRAVCDELKPHTLTIHKLLEFAPVQYDIDDPETGMTRKTMKFEPRRHAGNPLPPELKLLIFEESSMIDVALYNLLQDAMPHEHQEIFLGDIQQLPPVFGLAVLGFKMLELEKTTVELIDIYRQALESPIISTAWKILGGNPHDFGGLVERYKDTDTGVTRLRAPTLDALSRTVDAGSIKFQIWQKTLNADVALHSCIAQFKQWDNEGYYNPQDDIILCPFNKSFGTIELNKGISGYLGVKQAAFVHEVIAGFNKHYLAVGDRVLYDKEDAFIISIDPNPSYLGKVRPMAPSVNLDRYGVYQQQLTQEEILLAKAQQEEADVAAADHLMDNMSLDDVEDRVQASSHEVKIQISHDSEIITLKQAGEVNALLGGYAITVHKAQGSEYDNVFLVLHHSHAVMLERELVYTAITRAKKRCHIICENNSFEKAVKKQAIKGNTLAQKAVFFEGKRSSGDEDKLPIPSQKLSSETISGFMRAEASLTPHRDDAVDTRLKASTTLHEERSEATLEDRQEVTPQVESAADRARRLLADIRARRVG